MNDAPDFTSKTDTDIIAQTIGNLAVDIIAQTIAALKVDIITQTLAALKVDIITQTLAALKVDIITQTLAALKIDIITQTLAALKINITTQDLAQLVINIAAQTVGVYLQPDWATKQGIDKTFISSGAGKSFGQSVVLAYQPAAGKTFYTVQVSAFISPSAEADADNQHAGMLTLYPAVGGDAALWPGFNSGFAISLPVPLVTPGGSILWVVLANYSGHTCDIGVSVAGYEV